jgi:hypothetical protein
MTSLWIPGPWISGPGMVEPSDIWTFGLPDVSGLLGILDTYELSWHWLSPMPLLSSELSALAPESCPSMDIRQ